MSSYDPQIARAILFKLHERHWNPYHSNHVSRLGQEQVIQEGPARRLLLHGSYTLWPKIANSRDPQEVMAAFDRVATRLQQLAASTEINDSKQDDALTGFPTISFQDQRYTLSGFTLHPVVVRLHASKPLTLYYQKFLRSLDTLVRGAV